MMNYKDHGFGISTWDDKDHHVSVDSKKADECLKEWRLAVQPPWWARLLHRVFRVRYPWGGVSPLQEAFDLIPTVVTENVTVHLSGTFDVDTSVIMSNEIKNGKTLIIDGGDE